MPIDVSLDDISGVMRLVREVCDRWDDPRAWREHLLHGACRLLGGNVASIFAVEMPDPDHNGRVRTLVNVGLPEPVRESLLDASLAEVSQRNVQDVSNNTLPGMSRLFAGFAAAGWATAARSELTDEATFRASTMYRNFRRPLDCDDYVCSIRFVDVPSRVEVIDVDRPQRAAPFGPREVTILRLLHDEIAPLIGVRLATEEHLCRDGLSKRLRETLSLLLEGLSEKEAAAALRVGAFTVHHYVMMLHKHFRVSSRAELLAYFVRREPVPRPHAPQFRPA